MDINDLNIVITDHLDTNSNLTNMFNYNCAIIIYDTRRMGERVSKKLKLARAEYLRNLIEDCLKKEKSDRH
jgi:hypothetical protein